MTEAEWLVCEKPEEMLMAWGDKGSRRKWRLSVCAICRTAWHLLADECCRTAVETAEASADDPPAHRKQTDLAFNAAARAANAVDQSDQTRFAAACAVMSTMYASTGALTAGHLWDVFKHVANATGGSCSYPRQTALLRDIFGNPFRPATADPSWLTSDVVALASQMYESRDFSAMPILADALQDAGCDNADVLDHCRDPKATHVRGCWVVDLVLGKT